MATPPPAHTSQVMFSKTASEFVPLLPIRQVWPDRVAMAALLTTYPVGEEVMDWITAEPPVKLALLMARPTSAATALASVTLNDVAVMPTIPVSVCALYPGSIRKNGAVAPAPAEHSVSLNFSVFAPPAIFMIVHGETVALPEHVIRPLPLTRKLRMRPLFWYQIHFAALFCVR